MAVYRDVIVNIPPHSYAQKRGDVTYNYTYTDFYRNEDGKPRNKSKATGMRIENAEGKMHPNDNYYSLLRISHSRRESDLLNIGYAAVVEEGFSQLSLSPILSSVFGERRAKQIRSICSYLVKEGWDLSDIDRFTRKEYFSKTHEVLTEQMVNKLFVELTSDEINEFYSEWIPKAKSGSCICFDLSSFSPFPKVLPEGNDGDLLEHAKPRQMSLFLFASEDSQYPLYLFPYRHFPDDARYIANACASAREAGIDGEIKVVLDGRFFERQRLNTLHLKGLILTVKVPGSLEIAKNYIHTYGSDLFSPEYYLNDGGIYGRLLEGQEIFGIAGRVLIGLSTKSSVLLNAALDETLLRYEEEIPAIKEYEAILKKDKYTGLFDFEKDQEGNGFTFSRNEGKIRDLRNQLGFFVIFTTDQKATAQKIIDTYQAKDYAEKLFYDITQSMEAERIEGYPQQALEGKYSVLMIALILRAWLEKHLQAYRKAHQLTLRRCLEELSDIQMLVDKEEVRLLRSVTAEQSELLRLCEVNQEELEERVRQELAERMEGPDDMG